MSNNGDCEALKDSLKGICEAACTYRIECIRDRHLRISPKGLGASLRPHEGLLASLCWVRVRGRSSIAPQIYFADKKKC